MMFGSNLKKYSWCRFEEKKTNDLLSIIQSVNQNAMKQNECIKEWRDDLRLFVRHASRSKSVKNDSCQLFMLVFTHKKISIQKIENTLLTFHKSLTFLSIVEKNYGKNKFSSFATNIRTTFTHYYHIQCMKYMCICCALSLNVCTNKKKKRSMEWAFIQWCGCYTLGICDFQWSFLYKYNVVHSHRGMFLSIHFFMHILWMTLLCRWLILCCLSSFVIDDGI